MFLKLSRFGGLALTLVFLSEACTTPSESEKPEPRRIPMLQGATTKSTTQLSVLLPKKKAYRFELLRSGSSQIHQPDYPPSKNQRSYSNWSVYQFYYSNLMPEAAYVFRIRNDQGAVIDRRYLKTLDTERKNVRFALVSCQDDGFAKSQKAIWKELISQRPDVMFFIGDNVYTDQNMGRNAVVSPQRHWRRFAETWNRLYVYQMETLIPILATWDDHDYGVDDGDASYPYKRPAKENFDHFFAQSAIYPEYVKGPGVASRFEAFGQRFILTDNRTYRSRKTHWGTEQERWIFKNLNQSEMPTWIMNGSQFFGAYVKDRESYQRNQRRNFKDILKRFKRAKSPVVLVSGDAHLTELMRIPNRHLGYTTYELTTSGIHAAILPRFKKFPNPLQMVGRDDRMNYMIVESTAAAEALNFNVKAMGPNNEVLYSKDLKVSKSTN